ncbi:uncharacterized protein LOC117103402 [Anneissia japonica]|uniref:uncharacterized protein LOC117103402 n=1 Tax=Anneissia japonica TaxID=1529436 RepID=UPI0014255403|nr:uncharacterized protein LOC117103402 [Anneissia japonica]
MKTIKTTRGPEGPGAQVQEMIVEELTLKMRTGGGGGEELIEDLLVEGVDKGTERWNTSKGRGQHDYRNKDQSANNQHMDCPDHLSNMANGISTCLGSKSGNNRPQSRGGFRGRGRNREHNEETIEAIMIIQCLKI